MTARTLTRTAFVAAMLSAGALAVATPAHAARDMGAEAYVQERGAAALRTLGDASMSAAERRQTFDALIAQLSDMPRVAHFVLGRYGAQLRSDDALRREWLRTFQDYAIAIYEDRLQRYSGGSIRVTGSVERVAGRDVIVNCEITPRGGRPLPAQWRLLRSGDVWKVVDVSLIFEGNQIWLAQQQQRDFLAELDRNNGDLRALMANLRGLTASLRQRSTARG